MKKRTVITTEKREVWVIKRPAAVAKDENKDAQTSEPDCDSLTIRRDDLPDEGAPDEQEK